MLLHGLGGMNRSHNAFLIFLSFLPFCSFVFWFFGGGFGNYIYFVDILRNMGIFSPIPDLKG